MNTETETSFSITLTAKQVKSLLAFTSRDPSRVNLRQWRIAPTGSPHEVEIGATDGHGAIVFRLVISNTDQAPTEPVVMRLPDALPKKDLRITETGWHVGAAVFPYEPPHTFPPLENVIPTRVSDANNVCPPGYTVSTELLGRLGTIGKGLGAKETKQAHTTVRIRTRFQYPTDALGPLRVDLENAAGDSVVLVLMPMRP